jgi:hypothetical protein
LNNLLALAYTLYSSAFSSVIAVLLESSTNITLSVPDVWNVDDNYVIFNVLSSAILENIKSSIIHVLPVANTLLKVFTLTSGLNKPL